MNLNLKLIFLITTILIYGKSYAAEFYFIKLSPTDYQIQLDGEIKKGDYKRFISLVSNSPKSFMASPSISLSSLGGSVEEAIKIGELIDKASLMTVVSEGNVCASSCFLIFISGNMRHTTGGSILIHRPYISGESYNSDEVSKVVKKQRTSTKFVRQYLEDRSVNSNLIDKMMSLASSSAYKLSDDDLWSLGLVSPWFEEAAIAKCGASSKIILNTKLMTPKIKSCVSGLSDVSRAKLIIEFLGEKNGIAAIRKYIDSKKTK